jgi:hypothetical protein
MSSRSFYGAFDRANNQTTMVGMAREQMPMPTLPPHLGLEVHGAPRIPSLMEAQPIWAPKALRLGQSAMMPRFQPERRLHMFEPPPAAGALDARMMSFQFLTPQQVPSAQPRDSRRRALALSVAHRRCTSPTYAHHPVRPCLHSGLPATSGDRVAQPSLGGGHGV